MFRVDYPGPEFEPGAPRPDYEATTTGGLADEAVLRHGDTADIDTSAVRASQRRSDEDPGLLDDGTPEVTATPNEPSDVVGPPAQSAMHRGRTSEVADEALEVAPGTARYLDPFGAGHRAELQPLTGGQIESHDGTAEAEHAALLEATNSSVVGQSSETDRVILGTRADHEVVVALHSRDTDTGALMKLNVAGARALSEKLVDEVVTAAETLGQREVTVDIFDGTAVDQVADVTVESGRWLAERLATRGLDDIAVMRFMPPNFTLALDTATGNIDVVGVESRSRRSETWINRDAYDRHGVVPSEPEKQAEMQAVMDEVIPVERDLSAAEDRANRVLSGYFASVDQPDWQPHDDRHARATELNSRLSEGVKGFEELTALIRRDDPTLNEITSPKGNQHHIRELFLARTREAVISINQQIAQLMDVERDDAPELQLTLRDQRHYMMHIYRRLLRIT